MRNESFWKAYPKETEADCQDCTMCPTQNVSRNKSEFLFNRKTKCCTYMPELPNFLVGAVLQDESLEQAKGKAALEQQLSESLTITRPKVFRPGEVKELWNLEFHQLVNLPLFG